MAVLAGIGRALALFLGRFALREPRPSVSTKAAICKTVAALVHLAALLGFGVGRMRRFDNSAQFRQHQNLVKTVKIGKTGPTHGKVSS
jgi:hypothetical protein